MAVELTTTLCLRRELPGRQAGLAEQQRRAQWQQRSGGGQGAGDERKCDWRGQLPVAEGSQPAGHR